MKTLSDLTASIAALKASVDALIAKFNTPPTPVDVQQQVVEVDAIKSAVDAVVSPPATPAPPVA